MEFIPWKAMLPSAPDRLQVGWIRFQFAIWHDFLLGGGCLALLRGGSLLSFGDWQRDPEKFRTQNGGLVRERKIYRTKWYVPCLMDFPSYKPPNQVIVRWENQSCLSTRGY